MPQTGKIPVSAPVRTADDHDRHACIRSSHTPALSISSIALNRTDPLHPKVWARFECAGSCMPRHAPHAGWETYCLAHSPTFAQMYARTCISRQMLDGAFVMQLHPPDYADHDIRNAPNAMALCQCLAHSAGLCMPRHTEQSGVSSAGSIPRCTAARTLFNGLSPVSSRDIIPLFGIRGTGHGRRPASHTFNGCYSHRSFSTDGAEDEHIDDSADTENAEYPAFAPPCRVRDSARDLAEREPSLADAFTFSGGSNRRPYPLMMKTQTGMPKHLAMHWMKAARFRHAYCPWSCPEPSRRCPSQCRLLVVTIRLQNQRHHSLRARSV